MNLSEVLKISFVCSSLKFHLNVVIFFIYGTSKKLLNPASITKGHLKLIFNTSFAINLHLKVFAYL